MLTVSNKNGEVILECWSWAQNENCLQGIHSISMMNASFDKKLCFRGGGTKTETVQTQT